MQSKRLILSRSQSEALRLSQALTACGIANTLTRPPRSKQMPAWRVAVAIEQRDRARGAGLPAPKGKRCVVLGGCQ